MIISELKGGLGNQMFQYAHACALAHKIRGDFAIDARLYKKHTKRTYELDHFTITAKQAGIFDIFLAKIFGTYLSGYFQSENYFKDIENIIRKEFQFKEKELFDKKFSDSVEKIKISNSVAVHIRRGDYVHKSDVYVNLSANYYQKAMGIIAERVDNPLFFFFSDDIAWVKKHIPHPENSIFLSNETIEDLYLMSICKHQIIANSTFSWWGAWLNNNPKKIIITPHIWFTIDNLDTKDLLPKSWIQI